MEHYVDTPWREQSFYSFDSRNQMLYGLLYTFRDSQYWNFYDWSAYMDEKIGSTDTKPDLMINCLFVIALENFRIISEKIGKSFEYQKVIDVLKANIKQSFFDSKIGLFSMSKDREEFTELGNAVAILAGLTTAEESYAIAEKLSCNMLENSSLSMKCFKYDALLKVDSKYHPYIVKEICDTYKVMLDNGATSVWEVQEGANAFGKAGSLCHGWSAIPILYL